MCFFSNEIASYFLLQFISVYIRTPFVKYIEHCISYVIFLFIYSYFLLFEFDWRVQKSEVVVYIWFVTMALDEMREFIIQPGNRVIRKDNQPYS